MRTQELLTLKCIKITDTGSARYRLRYQYNSAILPLQSDVLFPRQPLYVAFALYVHMYRLSSQCLYDPTFPFSLPDQFSTFSECEKHCGAMHETSYVPAPQSEAISSFPIQIESKSPLRLPIFLEIAE